MTTLDYFTIEEKFVAFTPKGKYEFEELIEAIGDAISHCSKNNFKRLFVDLTEIVNLKSPTLGSRYKVIKEWASRSKGIVTIAMVVPEKILDPERFGIMVAINEGLKSNGFTSREEALEWLLKQ